MCSIYLLLSSEFSSFEIVVLDDFIVQNKDWLVSTKTDCQGKEAESFVLNFTYTNLQPY